MSNFISHTYEENIDEVIAMCKERWEYKDGELWLKRLNRPLSLPPPPAKGYKTVSIYENYKVVKTFKLHRVIFLLCHGYLPEVVDHIDGNPRNNRIENLRPATAAQNKFNRSYQPNVTGYKGVYIVKYKNKIRYGTSLRRKYLGMYDTPEEAHAAWCAEASKEYGEFANYG